MKILSAPFRIRICTGQKLRFSLSLFLSVSLVENVKEFPRKKSPSVKGKRPENAAVTLVHARERAYCEENGLVSSWDRN